MQLISRHELIYVTATLTYRGTTIELADVLIDTGAASTVINADLAADAGIFLAPERSAAQASRRWRSRACVHAPGRSLCGRRARPRWIRVEIGEMDYGFEFGGIIGIDFLRAARAVIDLGLGNLTIDFG